MMHAAYYYLLQSLKMRYLKCVSDLKDPHFPSRIVT